MPFQIGNTLTLSQNENILNAKLVNFLDWQNFEKCDPTSPFPIITNEFSQIIQYFQWGLVPTWAKNIAMGANMTKTKIENLLEKPALQAIYTYKRCIIPLTSYSAWANPEKTNIYDYTVSANSLICVAGLWSLYGEGLYTFSILTQKKTINTFDIDVPFHLNTSQQQFWLTKKELHIKDLAKIRSTS
jgi:putative SOS response-associated peptidase YedK